MTNQIALFVGNEFMTLDREEAAEELLAYVLRYGTDVKFEKLDQITPGVDGIRVVIDRNKTAEMAIRKETIENFVAYTILFNASLHACTDSAAYDLLSEHRYQFLKPLNFKLTQFVHDTQPLVRPYSSEV